MVSYTMNVVSVGRLCVASLGVIEKMRVIVEPAKRGNPKRNSIIGMLNEVFYNTIVVSVSRGIVEIVMLTIGRQRAPQTMNGIEKR